MNGNVALCATEALIMPLETHCTNASTIEYRFAAASTQDRKMLVKAICTADLIFFDLVDHLLEQVLPALKATAAVRMIDVTVEFKVIGGNLVSALLGQISDEIKSKKKR